MPQTYEVTAPNGKTLEISGDRMPTEAELHEIFRTAGVDTTPVAPPPVAPEPSMAARAGQAAVDVGAGVLKGAANTAVNLGRMVHKIPGVDAVLGEIPDDAASALGLDPTNGAQRAGQFVEQAAEFMLPAAGAEKLAATAAGKIAPMVARSPKLIQAMARLAPRAVAQGATSGAVTIGQGGDAATGAVIGAAGPVVGAAAVKAGQGVGALAAPMVRTAIKPTVSAMKRIAGASAEGLDAKAGALVDFIVTNGLTTAEKARTVITKAEQELQRVLAVKNAPTDAPTRALRYLSALERSASKQGLPADDVALLRNAAAEVLEGKLGKDEITMVLKPHPTLVKPDGKPFMVLTPETARVPRTDVMADEALDLARANSKWSTRKQWGEQKGASMEASKAIERAERDAMKTAVPEARPILSRYSKGIQAAEVLDRMAFRQNNREAVSLPAHVMGAAEIMSGKLPILAAASNWIRNNGVRGGVWAHRLSKALERQDVKEAGEILNRLGVAVAGASATP